jgi:hypothetical protein
MFTEITMYKTHDGKVFDTEKKARQHIETVIHDAFLKGLRSSINDGYISPAQAITLTTRLYTHREELLKALYLEFKDALL